MKFYYTILFLALLVPVTRAQALFTEYGAGYASSRIEFGDNENRRGGIAFSSGIGYSLSPYLQGVMILDYSYFAGNNSHLLRAVVDAFSVSEGYMGDFYDRWTTSLRLRFSAGDRGIVPFFSAGGGFRAEKQRVAVHHRGRYPYDYPTEMYDFGTFLQLGGGVKLSSAEGYTLGIESIFLLQAKYAKDNYSINLFFSSPL